tara:strand:- start:4421 stop:4669 length:249 start_codon:yes stop_codon:yes gene_type:complete
MVDEMDTNTEANVEIENSTPEGADEGQTGDQGGDADGANFGQDEGSEDTMSAEGEGMSTGMKVVTAVGIGAIVFGIFSTLRM